jgi:uncharacterized protein involved in type VI secretion and phage assembly
MAAGKIDKDNGIVIGTVDDLEDPEHLGRVRVKFEHLAGQLSDWAWLVSPMAGKDRGLFLRPEKGDQVLVAFVHGDPAFPYILGSMWSKQDVVPKDDGDAKKNNWRFLKSRSGHLVKLDDTAGKEKIAIVDQSGELTVELDSAKKKISIVNDGGDVEIASKSGKVTVSATGGQLKLEGLNIEVSASASLKLTATGNVTIQGAMVLINS